MTLEEITFFTEQISNMRLEIRGDIAELKVALKTDLATHALELKNHEQRLTKIENFNWKLGALTFGSVALVQLIVNVAIEIIRS